MTGLDEHGRPDPPLASDEVATLLGFLDFHRATLAWKYDGVDESGSRLQVGASSMTLGGLIKHMTYVEDVWFSVRLHNQQPQPPWDSVDWTSDPDWEWHTAANDTPQQLRSQWLHSVERSRALTTQALAAGGLDQRAARPLSNGHAPALRWIVVHMIEEYARHNGHADLFREAVDGSTGE